MGSSKSLRLLTTAYNFEEKGIDFLCFKSSIDTRDGDGIIKSRIGVQRECIKIEQSDNLFKIISDSISNNQHIKKILIDESQFLTKRQVEQLGHVVDTFDIDVMCYGLRTDFRTELFEGSKRLLELADTIEEVKSHCSCGRKAIINARFTSNGDIVLHGNQVEIGGNDRYKPLCRKCYQEECDKLCYKMVDEYTKFQETNKDKNNK